MVTWFWDFSCQPPALCVCKCTSVVATATTGMYGAVGVEETVAPPTAALAATLPLLPLFYLVFLSFKYFILFKFVNTALLIRNCTKDREDTMGTRDTA